MTQKLLQPSLDIALHKACPRRVSKFQCLLKQPSPQLAISFRGLSTSTPQREESYIVQNSRPRWAHTPERMRAPVSLKRFNPKNRWIVNESQDKLDDFYVQLLGDGGDKLLTEEVKWLAVTHKSFAQGRRGYNDRLAFLGMNLVGRKPLDCAHSGNRQKDSGPSNLYRSTKSERRHIRGSAGQI